MSKLDPLPGLSPYPLHHFYDEMFEGERSVRPHYKHVNHMFTGMSPEELQAKQHLMQRRMMEEGITFTLYNPAQDHPMERTIPFDMIPRIIAKDEWEKLEAGIIQRVTALNLFIHDIYHEQYIVKDGIVPRKMVISNCYFRPEMTGLRVPGGAYITTSGIDLIRHHDGNYYVLEDNLRTPSGFSYLFKGRSLMNQLFPELSFSSSIRDVEHSINRFLSVLRSLSPSRTPDPVIALLTPGEYNSAYYEHAFLAQQMGVHLVEGRDLVIQDHKLYLREMNGLKRVDVLYRRLDDDYIDPLAFDPNSLLGVAGLMNAYRAGNVAIANAPGTGVADDKAMYVYVPEMIRYYLKEEPILNNVPTYLLSKPDERQHVLDHLEEMVVKETSLSGGYGMLIGSEASRKEREDFRLKILAEPERYIAQPIMSLSRAPILSEGQMVPRHIDLRAFVLMGADRKPHVIPGGLTRVAMKEGSLVVNSSQGGGVKDTWVMS
ncbi:circularly permuted type 2 ATP-grasp protein [Paenibacillus sp. 7124]|uniref:Circularly permuted type 2 ATP-grasp protein n=1 Tax=Paenibacillus apii TaxID=1850370 RepID=A0A6M1PNJ2_9BACL|nr:circularly permuted type 2 ATP-grasp protein [Paenibacillus apii]NGM84048.1 circularly permuted type 2 ATP-grasp protein [Paenibacillus apii]NJJ38771.1 circularly permuted type 2 ATP-grasp protein [Paenibacillus apii]